ncbi:MAG: hypothetical protein RIA08_09665 [Roseovarius sp.]|uniref:hypothetical protein n=1 Tax=Roseovarius sp. TaxID=1486281 RepID=UPI0032F05FAD
MTDNDLKAENDRLREALALIMPLAECYVTRLEDRFQESNGNGALYAHWQDVLSELEAAKSTLTGSM